MSEAEPQSSSRMTPYQKRLFLFLSVATFFEGYDFMAVSQILRPLRLDFGLDQAQGGQMLSVINVGTVLAFFLVRYADKWGRKRLLTLTIAGYTVATLASGLAPEVYSFTFFQLIARIFLIGEWATSVILISEEFPSHQRGMVIGFIQGFSSLGSIMCAGVAKPLADTTFGWRAVYIVAVVPLVILAVARRGLKESRRFEELKEQRASEPRRNLFHIWGTPYRTRMLQVALIWGLTYLCTNTAISFWRDFVVTEGRLTNGQAGNAIIVAAVGSMPLVFGAGKVLDLFGRKLGALGIFGLAALGVILSYSLEGFWPLALSLVFAIFGASAVLPVLNAFTTELFPTDLRGDAFAWCNNLIGRIGYVIGPGLFGFLAREAGSYERPMQLSTLGPLLALMLIFLWLPETKNRELEDTAQLT
ncbi:MAG: MFS transporter [Myxococcota bacterium]